MRFVFIGFCVYSEGVVSVHGLSETVVGVLGGGQLGRMLCQAASQMGIKVIVLDPQESCPASQLAYDHVLASFDDTATVQKFAKRFDYIGLACLILVPLLYRFVFTIECCSWWWIGVEC